MGSSFWVFQNGHPSVNVNSVFNILYQYSVEFFLFLSCKAVLGNVRLLLMVRTTVACEIALPGEKKKEKIMNQLYK